MIFALNAGSASLKFALYADDRTLTQVLAGAVLTRDGETRLTIAAKGNSRPVEAEIKGDATEPGRALPQVFDHLRRLGQTDGIAAVGHRFVHGGTAFAGPAPLNRGTLDALTELTSLAPAHQPASLAGVAAATAALPRAVQVGCFDTAFHADQPRLARLYGLPRYLSNQGIVGYGFHGLSYSYIASALQRRFGNSAGGRAIVAHLGSGVSLCAMREGRSVATTMGFSTLDGPPMATRSGSLDPGVVLHLIQSLGMAPQAVGEMLHQRSGLLGVSEISGDLRDLLGSDQPAAQEAIDLFVYRIGREIGSLTATLGGLDTLVFTAGVGENSPSIRARIAETAAWLGVALDAGRNQSCHISISAAGSPVEVLVIPTDEQRSIAQGVRAWLGRR
ncbi:MAG: acetate/propionate family kinase [Caulobacter sp.]|nr:acetate/propionate family kinase [Caulobacter sp.]